jgi:type II secretory pathway component PulF
MYHCLNITFQPLDLMMKKNEMTNLSKILSKLSTFFSNRKGLLIFIAIILVILNFILSLVSNNWVTQSNLLLHLGIVIGFLGLLIAWAL